MNIDSSSDLPFGSFPVDSGTSLSPSSGYVKKFNLGAVDHDMEVSTPSSPPKFIQWSPPSSMTTPENHFIDSGHGFPPGPYPERFIQPAKSRMFDFNIPSASSFTDVSGITMNDASSSRADPQLRLLSPFGHDAGEAHLSVGPVLLPGHEDQEQQPPRRGRYISSRTRGYPMPYNYKAPSSAEGPDDEHSPGEMRHSRIEGCSRIFGGNEGLKSRRNHAKEKEAMSKRPRATAARSRKRATNAGMSRSGSISRQIAPSDGFSMQNSQGQTTALMAQGGLANANTRSIVDSDRSRDTVEVHDLAKHNSTTFRDLEEANVSGCVLVNSSAPVIVNHGVSSRQLPSNKDCNCAVGATGIPSTRGTSSTIPTPEANSEHSEYEIYFKYLTVKRRGIPLWKPGPQLELPLEYRKSGVSHGDVGVLDSTGTFNFLFNIFLPADHEINRWGGVPNGFTPLQRSKAQRTMEVTRLSNRCLKSSSLRRTDGHSFDSHFVFQTTGREGAVLVVPDGGFSEDLKNYKLLENYIAANAESWGEFVESEDCGVPTENGIQVVVGTDKVSSWGMATFENVELPMQFEFTSHWTSSQTRTSSWKWIDGQAGPEEEDIQNLLIGSPLRNQCVFVRTLNVSVSRTVRDKSAIEVCSSCSLSDSMRNEGNPGRRNVDIKISQVGSSQISHPLKSLSKYLLENCPNAKVVITRDSDWMSIITENDTILPNVEEVCKRVLASHFICEEEGVVTLEKREKIVPVSVLHPFTVTTTADDTPASYYQSSYGQPLPEMDPNNNKGTTSIPATLGIGSLPADPTSLSSSPSFPVPSSPRAPRGSPIVTKRLYPLSFTQFVTEFPPLSSSQPHEGQSGNYPQEAPVDPAGPAEGSSGAETWKFYSETFKTSKPPREQEFKEKVGTYKTARASLIKRKEAGKWICPIEACNSTFTRKQNLMHHTQSHLGIKNHQCSCGKAFNALSGLKRHQKTCRSLIAVTGELGSPSLS